MGERDELKFARLCAGGRLAHYLSPGMMTGAHPRLEFFATRASVQRRYLNRAKLNLSVAEERRALEAFYGHMLPVGRTDEGRDVLEAIMEGCQ